jgi:hypothetical protein
VTFSFSEMLLLAKVIGVVVLYLLALIGVLEMVR